MKTERDINSIKWTAEMRGLEKGKQEGRAKEKIEVAKAFKEKGVNMELICQCTGLSIEQIEKL